MKAKKVKVEGFNITSVRDYFKSMTKELLQEYVKFGGTVHHVTVDVGALIFMPAGCLFAERSGKGSANFGVRMGALPRLGGSCLSSGIEGLEGCVEVEHIYLGRMVCRVDRASPKVGLQRRTHAGRHERPSRHR